jgi:glycosyltransferase involved in cell wall biosynthesis
MAFRSSVSRVAALHITDPNALVVSDRHRLMTTVYDLIPLHQGRSAETPGYRRYLKRLQAVRTIFAISQATAQDVVATLSVPQGRVVVARPGVDIPARDQSSPPPVRGKYFLYVGSPDPHKNLGVLLEAMKLCPELGEKLVITGNWPDSSVFALRSQAEADTVLHGRVEHLGYVTREELLSLFRWCTALVMPSLIEGFGLPVAEAMAAGAAVVHSRLPVLEEVSAGCALTFAPTSADELANCLRKVSTDSVLRQELIARGRRRAESLTWAEALERTLQVYREVIQGGGRD